MKEFLARILNLFGWAWWLEIVTEIPHCTYYFGPFITAKEAAAAQDGYIEDLEAEAANGINVMIKRCKPAKLTIEDELADSLQRQKITNR